VGAWGEERLGCVVLIPSGWRGASRAVECVVGTSVAALVLNAPGNVIRRALKLCIPEMTGRLASALRIASQRHSDQPRRPGSGFYAGITVALSLPKSRPRWRAGLLYLHEGRHEFLPHQRWGSLGMSRFQRRGTWELPAHPIRYRSTTSLSLCITRTVAERNCRR
jgi:hypothetical protein